ncbi:hypothetical protein [Bordetella genomosp. 12]|uniref:Uncharacterized protein n=1 Tax=Bordetella genomosp. 12 TaxID=463035 RepID=A0A261VM56_9BORD|nr:hypothetical protein [Bordetella genomosp. 12]OZI75228.1 hypothetical protein CAL22_10800 [Bordetella genomosp. 12]
MRAAPFPPSIFLYTEEQRGNQLVESEVVGMLSDISGAEKFVVIRDPHADLQYVYRVDHASSNLDAVAMTQADAAHFDGKHSIQINAMSYRLGTPAAALALLRGTTHWIQDKGALLSVLLHNAASRGAGFSPRRIHRERVYAVPPGVPIERLSRHDPGEQDGSLWLMPEGDER